MFEKAIAELLAKQEITEALYRIARGTDRGDLALFASGFHEDGEDYHGLSNGPVANIIANLGRFQAKPLLDAITENRVTTICAPPTVWRMFVQEDLTSWKTSLREVCSAGEPLNPEVIEQVKLHSGEVESTVART